MATKTNVELSVNLRSGQNFVPAGRHVLPDSPYSDILQAEIDAKASHVTVLGTIEVPDEDEGDEGEGTEGEGTEGATTTGKGKGGRRKPATPAATA